MRKRCLIQIFLLGLLLAAWARAAEFYVSAGGRDTNPGTLRQPFGTIQRARDEVRKLIAAGLRENVTVFIRGGVYSFNEPLVFGMDDSGTEQYTITYAAYQLEEPILSGGVKITGWKKLENSPAELPPVARGKVWVADVPASLGRFHSLYDSKGLLPRAQGDGFIPAIPPAGAPDDARNPEALRNLYYPPGVIKNWPNLDDVELVIRPSIAWTMNILALESVDEKAHVARTQLPASYPLRRQRDGSSPGPLTFNTAWIENVLEALDQPGEWVLNTHTRKLYLWPRGEKPDESIVAPSVRELLRVEGKIDVNGPTDVPVLSLVFKGLTLMHADRLLWAKGDKGMQHDWEMEDKPDALIRLRGAERCVIENCKFKDSGGNAIRMDYYAQRNRVVGNEIRNLGGGGIILFGYGPGTKDVNRRNEILNNDIHHSGLLYWHSHGIVLWQSGENRVANNYIHDMPRKAVCLSGARYPYFERARTTREVASTFRWFEIGEPGKTSYDEAQARFLHTRNNIIEDNEVAHVLQKLGDGAAINTTGAGQGNVIRHNYLHDIFGSEWVAAALRNDDWQRGTTWEYNVIARSTTVFAYNKGVNHIINNVAVDVALPSTQPWVTHLGRPNGYVWIRPIQPIDGARFERNILYNSKGEANFFVTFAPDNSTIPDPFGPNNDKTPAASGYEILGRNKIGDNLYYNAGVKLPSVPKFLEGMRAHGIGSTDMYADPLFMDVEHGDYRLRPDSPALKLGIKSIDLSNVGLTKDFPKRLLE